MSTDKSDALVIRLADFSESSRVVTLFTRDYGKISALAKGAKRLRSSFEVSLDLLSECRVVFIRKQAGALDLLTEAQLIRRFAPHSGSLTHLNAGYYVAELLGALSEEHDPHPEWFAAAVETLSRLGEGESPLLPVCQFEIATLREIGQLPDFDTCTICQSALETGSGGRFWVTQSGLICSQCGHPEYQSTEFQPGSLAVLRRLVAEDSRLVDRMTLSDRQQRDLRRLLTSAISHVLGRRPRTLPLLKFW